jgi:hypothetical protein
MKTLLSMVTVTVTALTLAATSLAVGEAKNQSPFTHPFKTQGVCSYQVKPVSCYLTPSQARLASLWLAESMGVAGTTYRGA